MKVLSCSLALAGSAFTVAGSFAASSALYFLRGDTSGVLVGGR